MFNKYIPNIRRILAASFVLLPIAAGAKNILVEDTFSSSSERPKLTSLEGTTPERAAGLALWKAGEGAPTPFGILSGNGTLVARSSIHTGAAFPMEMRLSIVPVKESVTTATNIVSKGSDWVAFGYLSSDEAGERSWFNTEDTLLWILFRPNGAWTLYQNGTEVLLTSGKLDEYREGDSVRAGLEYDPQTQRARPFIVTPYGEQDLYGQSNGWVAVNFPPDLKIQAVGLRINPLPDGRSVAGEAFIDDFYVVGE